MNRERVFRRYAPPPGGLAQLRERLEKNQGRWWMQVSMAGAAAVAASVVVAVLLLVGRNSSPSAT